jgi:hypothetical protein
VDPEVNNTTPFAPTPPAPVSEVVVDSDPRVDQLVPVVDVKICPEFSNTVNTPLEKISFAGVDENPWLTVNQLVPVVDVLAVESLRATNLPLPYAIMLAVEVGPPSPGVDQLYPSTETGQFETWLLAMTNNPPPKATPPKQAVLDVWVQLIPSSEVCTPLVPLAINTPFTYRTLVVPDEIALVRAVQVLPVEDVYTVGPEVTTTYVPLP